MNESLIFGVLTSVAFRWAIRRGFPGALNDCAGSARVRETGTACILIFEVTRDLTESDTSALYLSRFSLSSASAASSLFCISLKIFSVLRFGFAFTIF